MEADVESAPKESATREIQLPDDDPMVVEKMIQYLYTLDYSVPGESNTSVTRTTRSQRRKSQADNLRHVDPLCFHVWIYALADRLLIEGLKVFASRYFHELLECSLDSSSFARAVEEVYSSTPPEDRGLRDLVIQVTLKNLSTLGRTGSPI